MPCSQSPGLTHELLYEYSSFSELHLAHKTSALEPVVLCFGSVLLFPANPLD